MNDNGTSRNNEIPSIGVYLKTLLDTDVKQEAKLSLG